MLAGVLKATLLHIYQHCVSKLYAHVDLILGVYWVVGALFSGTLKQRFNIFTKIARASFTPTWIFKFVAYFIICVLLAGALKATLLHIYQIA